MTDDEIDATAQRMSDILGQREVEELTHLRERVETISRHLVAKSEEIQRFKGVEAQRDEYYAEILRLREKPSHAVIAYAEFVDNDQDGVRVFLQENNLTTDLQYRFDMKTPGEVAELLERRRKLAQEGTEVDERLRQFGQLRKCEGDCVGTLIPRDQETCSYCDHRYLHRFDDHDE